ncbi:Hypothetical protein AJAP_34785 [Amycolatopsis japonica]|uniref:Phosphoglycerate mutase n=1 Tax=Amycolatopsis japonica TaxID=208439 RepID=A0A075V5K4_9PSEU|nr:histidine phosphatase family protein [Amycolatopsis japonica]AIG79764.1 Hypothetical protein AJAP_34785 [Amycolatopsis japonica]
MSCEIVLVRHAESVPPSPGKPDDRERPLTAAGVAAAELLAHELAGMNPTAVVSSPYRRAVATVAPAARAAGLEVTTRWELREWDSGLEPTPDYAAHYERSWADPDFARPGGESLRQLTARAMAAVDRLAEEYDGGVVLVGSHGTFVSRLLAGIGPGIDWPFSRDMPMPAVHRLRETGGVMGGVSRNLNYDLPWPVPEFVGLSVAQALALAAEAEIVLYEADATTPLTGRSEGRVVRQSSPGSRRHRPTRVTVWITP